MKFLVDETMGRKVTQYLQSKGHDVVYVGEEFAGEDDKFILAKAVQENRIVITLDKDFGDLVFFHSLPYKGVVLLRLRDERVENRIKVIERLLAKYSQRLPGDFAVATDGDERMR